MFHAYSVLLTSQEYGLRDKDRFIVIEEVEVIYQSTMLFYFIMI